MSADVSDVLLGDAMIGNISYFSLCQKSFAYAWNTLWIGQSTQRMQCLNSGTFDVFVSVLFALIFIAVNINFIQRKTPKIPEMLILFSGNSRDVKFFSEAMHWYYAIDVWLFSQIFAVIWTAESTGYDCNFCRRMAHRWLNYLLCIIVSNWWDYIDDIEPFWAIVCISPNCCCILWFAHSLETLGASERRLHRNGDCIGTRLSCVPIRWLMAVYCWLMTICYL